MKQLVYYSYTDKWKEETGRLGINDYDYALLLLEKEKCPTRSQIACKADADRVRKSRHEKGIYFPQEDNDSCSRYFGIHIAERYVCSIFDDPIKMPNDNPGFDWICKKGYKIQHKARCLTYRDKRIYWALDVKYNDIADYFIYTLWDNRQDLDPLHVMMFNKYDIIRGYPFWMRNSINVTNKPNYLIEFRKYELSDKLEKLKKICEMR